MFSSYEDGKPRLTLHFSIDIGIFAAKFLILNHL